MGHNLEQLGTASLDTMGGLVTSCNPQDLPEGASPRCWDNDYIIGSTFTRAGLESVYTYTSVLNISALTVYGGFGTFTYSGPTPSVNEGFLLSNFTANTFALNGQTVYVTSVNPIAGTFTADVVFNAGTYLLLSGVATSTVGDFLGPNVPTSAVSTGITGSVWSTPTAVMGNASYATTATGSTVTPAAQVPIAAGSLPIGGQALWSSPTNVLSTGASFASIVLTAGQTQDPVAAYQGTLAIPSDATVTGVKVSFQGKSTAAGTGSINLQLADGSTLIPYGTAVNVPLSTSVLSWSKGSSSYTWGTTITPAQLNGHHLGVLVSAVVSSGTSTISINSLSITVTYTLAGSSEALVATGFVFTVPATTGLTGFGVSFQAFTSIASSVTLQLLKNGLPVGQPITQLLTTTPTVYELGNATNLWGSTWLYSDVNNMQFGVQITSSGQGQTSVNDLDVLAYISPALVNFNYVKSYIQDDDQTYTLALDASGIMWEEDVTNNPGVLYTTLSGILPGSFAQSNTDNNKEYVLFSDLSIGTERPRVYNGTTWRPLSQIGPGAPPTFTAVQASQATPLAVSAYSVSGGIVTFTFTTATTPVVGALYVLSGTGNVNIDNRTFSVLGTPSPSTTQFSANAGLATGSASGLTGSAAATNNFNITSITQDWTTMPPFPAGQPAAGPFTGEAQDFNGQEQLWGAGPSLTGPGFIYTSYYSGANAPENYGIQYMSSHNYDIYVYVVNDYFINGTAKIATHGKTVPPSETANVPYFTTTALTSGNQRHGGPNNNFGPGNPGTFQLSLATVTTGTFIPNISAGDTISITGANPNAWNSTWTVVDSLDSGQYAIHSSQSMGGGVVRFVYTDDSAFGQTTITNGQTISLSQMVSNLAYNTVGVVSNSVGDTFEIAGFSGALPVDTNPIPENGIGVTYGNQFLIDPGSLTVGTPTNPIYGDTTVGGTVSVIGGQQIPIGVGIRQGVVYFITDNEYETPVSYPFEFTTPIGTQQIVITNIPIGPPDVIARGIAITEAGQNGVPGDNFYVIMEPVTTKVNATTITIPSTIINDNITTSIAIAFTDAVLLDSREIDIQGDNLFNLIELGSSAWCVPYSERMFYGLQLNKINNWTTGGGLTFDQGYLLGVNQPLGWSLVNAADQTLVTSPVTGQALYIKNQNATTQTVGMIYQTAFQDTYNVAIIQPNTTYSVRLAASAPSGLTGGTLTVDLTTNSPGTGFGQTFGSFSVPLSSMSTVTKVFTGTLLTTKFITVPSTLVLRVYLANAAPGADALIDRIEVFPTQTPYLKAQVYGSYPGQPEAIDASSTGGVLDTTSENAQACMGGFVMHDLLYLMKTASWYSTQDNPNSEPGGCGLHEVSNRVGTIGIASYDYGEEWCLTACRSGVYGFDGGQPTKISQEIWNLWEQINWDAGNTIVLRNDVVSKRMYVAIPLPTGVNPATGIPANKYTHVWLPNAPYNPKPTSPNVVLMLNYQGLADIKEMMMSPEVHTTMFGTLAAVDMKRKWTIWNIATPYMQFIMQPDGESVPLYICNGIGSSKIYKLNQDKYSDDGVAINSLYTSYAFVNAAKAATLPIFGFHAKRYTVFQTAITGGQLYPSTATNARIRMLPNTLTPKFPYTVPVGIPLTDPVQDDFFRPINVKGNRMFVEVSTNAVGSWFNLSKMLLTGKADPWSTLNATGGGNAGIV